MSRSAVFPEGKDEKKSYLSGIQIRKSSESWIDPSHAINPQRNHSHEKF